jgi:all-trans-8'-apo-beta-carotenal 15,15'-oxygenase
MSYLKLFNRSSYKTFDKVKLTSIFGKLPDNLKGVLYRNTSVIHERKGVRLNHWFDGDGAIVRLEFNNGEVLGSYKFIETKAYKEESKKGRFIYPNLGNTANTLWDKIRLSSYSANRANTNAFPVEGKLLTLWEGGRPYSLDLETLDTIGEDNLGGALKENMSYLAHPKMDPDSGEIYSIGQTYGDISGMNVYKSNRRGDLIKWKNHKFNSQCMFIHDVCLAGDYIAFFVFPINLSLLPVLLRSKSVIDCLKYDPNSPSHLVILNKHDLSLVKTIKYNAFFSFHYSNGYVDSQGNLIIDLVKYDDFGVFKYTENLIKSETEMSQGRLVRFSIDVEKGSIKETVLYDKYCEFPIIDSNIVGKNYETLYMNYSESKDNLFHNICRYDINKDQMTRFNFGPNQYPSEAVYVKEAKSLLTVVYNADKDQSELYINDSNSLDPVSILELPEPIPLGFHGNWRGL